MCHRQLVLLLYSEFPYKMELLYFPGLISCENTEMLLKEAVSAGARHCFRPVIMTATVAVVGLFPASVSTNIGSDVQRPLATVIVYGLFFATIISLYVLPALYYMVEKTLGKGGTKS